MASLSGNKKMEPPCLLAALRYAEDRNWHMFPARLEAGKKFSWLSKANAPDGANWGMTNDPVLLRKNFLHPRWRLKCGVGLPTGAVNDLFVIETDTKRGHAKLEQNGEESLKRMEREHGPLPPTLMARSPSGSIHRFYKYPGCKIKSIDNVAGYIGVDCKGDGGMVVIPPTRRDDGEYEWVNDLPIAEAPDWLVDLVADRPLNGNGQDQDNPFLHTSVHAPVSVDELQRLIRAVPNNNVGWDEWNRVGMAIFSSFPNDTGLAAFDAWSQKSSKYDAEQTLKKWRAFYGSPPTQITIASLIHLANEADPAWRENKKPESTSPPSIEIISIEELAALPVEPPQWIVENFVMKEAVNGLFGDGGTGKDYLLLQLGLSMVSGHRWLDMEIEQGSVLYYNMEDPLRLLRWRQEHIVNYYGFDCAKFAGHMHIVPMIGKDGILGLFNPRLNRVMKTAQWETLLRLMDRLKPDLLILGNRVNIFAVAQNDDSQARQCMTMLAGLQLDYGCTLIMPSHVSKAGMHEGSAQAGTSGNVQWSNACRHRLWLSMPQPNSSGGNGEDADTPAAELERNQRTLMVMKSNWGPSHIKQELVWSDVLRLYVAKNEGMSFAEKFDTDLLKQKVEEELLDMLTLCEQMGQRVSAERNARNYLPKLFAHDDVPRRSRFRGDDGFKLFKDAMQRLIASEAIRSESYGKHGYSRLVRVQP